MAEYARITAAVDGSKNAERALDAAVDLAKRFNSELTIVTVVPLHVVYSPGAAPPPSVYEAEDRAYTQLLADAGARAKAAGAKAVTTVLLRGIVVNELLGYLETHPADLVVVGARGLSAGERLFLGSTSDALAHHLATAILIVKSAA